MFGKKKEQRPKRDPKSLAQYGLFDIPSDLSLDNTDNLDEDDDEDLESELLALTRDSDAKPARPPRRKAAPAPNLDKMVADSLRDLPSDEELSGDEDDPELLNELSMITENDAPPKEEPTTPSKSEESDTISVLKARLQMYTLAEQNAKKSGETSRARRFNRGIKTIQDLIKQVNAGKAINPEDIPPEVSTGENKKPEQTDANIPVRKAPEIPQIPKQTPQDTETDDKPIEPTKTVDEPAETDEKEATLNMLRARKDEYKLAAVKAKRSGDAQSAIKFMKIGKQFDMVITALEEGQEVDLSNMPGSPDTNRPNMSETVRSGPPDTVRPGPSGPTNERTQSEVQSQDDRSHEVSEEMETEEKLIDPPTLLEGLIQRMAVYQKQQEHATQEGNSSKARRMGRIIKQYETAIKSHKNGKTVALDELPNPPGFVSLIPPQPAAPSEPPGAPSTPSSTSTPAPASTNPVVKPEPPSSSVSATGKHAVTSRSEKLIGVLVGRQREFRGAALQAKAKGEMAQAKEYLRAAKGFDKLIEAAKCGLPVDMDSLPLPPSARSQIEDSFDLVMAEECTEDDSGTLDILTRLEEQLSKQLKLCLSTRDHHKALGDVAGTNRFENLALTVTRDLDLVRLARRTGPIRPPRFHYENKTFSVVKCCTDLNDNDLEITIVRGVNYNCANPKEIDTFVKFEFPYPQEDPVKDRTQTIKDTNNPEYNSTYTLQIQRTSRPCLRVFKRQALKLEVYSKGGFFRGDTLLGSVNIKLQPLETQCELHDSYDLMDGRKKVGGKLEVRLRVRNPLVTKQIEQLNEKWLIIDQ